MADDRERRLGIGEAATALSVSKDTIRRRIRRGELDAVRDNTGQWRVRLPVGTPAVPKQRAEGQAASRHAPMQAHVGSLMQQVADLQRRLDEAAIERERLLAIVERLTAERRPERPPWPGLKVWWRRVWEGEG